MFIYCTLIVFFFASHFHEAIFLAKNLYILLNNPIELSFYNIWLMSYEPILESGHTCSNLVCNSGWHLPCVLHNSVSKQPKLVKVWVFVFYSETHASFWFNLQFGFYFSSHNALLFFVFLSASFIFSSLVLIFCLLQLVATICESFI